MTLYHVCMRNATLLYQYVSFSVKWKLYKNNASTQILQFLCIYWRMTFLPKICFATFFSHFIYFDDVSDKIHVYLCFTTYQTRKKCVWVWVYRIARAHTHKAKGKNIAKYLPIAMKYENKCEHLKKKCGIDEDRRWKHMFLK